MSLAARANGAEGVRESVAGLSGHSLTAKGGNRGCWSGCLGEGSAGDQTDRRASTAFISTFAHVGRWNWAPSARTVSIGLMAISAKMRKFALTNPRYMKRILYFLMLIGLCACSGSKTILPNSVYNVKLGETYTESQLIDALNKDTFRRFRVWHNGDTFLPGMYDTFYVSERENCVSYSCMGRGDKVAYSFCDYDWQRFRIETDTKGKLTTFNFFKGTYMTDIPVAKLKTDRDNLCARLHRLYGASEDTEEDGMIRNIWKDAATCLTVEYHEKLDDNDGPWASLICNVSLHEDNQ